MIGRVSGTPFGVRTSSARSRRSSLTPTSGYFLPTLRVGLLHTKVCSTVSFGWDGQFISALDFQLS